MECSVRYVHEVNMQGEPVGSIKPALCFRGKAIAHAVINDETRIRVIEIPQKDYDKSNPVLYHGDPYEPKPYADRLLMSAKLAGKPMTRRARQLLMWRDAVQEETMPTDDLEVEDPGRIYASNTPAERFKAAKKPGPVVNRTAEVRAAQHVEEAVRRAERPAAPIPVPGKDAKPSKAAKTAPVQAKAKPSIANADRGKLVKKLAAEFGKTPFDLRVLIRATGMRAPYEDEKAIRKALKGKV